ncbi:MAG: restriction endonuclease [Chlorobiaceae bacterium]|nr:restriction endonuclease [Chlorobiaceae bacterium]
MAINLADYENKSLDAIRAFWGNRDATIRKHREVGHTEDECAIPKPGKNMDGFLALMLDIVRSNGLGDAEIHRKSGSLTLPGFFRPTKFWDLLVIHKGQLIAAIELKSQIGPSFGNNFNSRIEQAVGNAHDFWIAYRDGSFGKQPRPFLGWLIVVEDATESYAPVKEKSLHFPISEEFKGVSYLQRYDLFCQKLVREQLYTAAAVISTPRNAAFSGKYSSISSLTNLKTFVTRLAGHVAAEAVRIG